MAKKFRYQHIMSAVEGKLPTAEQLKDAEIAVNVFAGAEKLAIKNSNGDIVTFGTEAQANDAIAAAVEGFIKADDVYSKAEVDEKVAPLAVKSEVTEEINAAATALQDGIDDLEEKKANVEDVPSVEGLAFATAVTAEIAAAVAPLAVKAEVTEEINAASVNLQQGIDELDEKKVDWTESTPGRKHIVLKNHDSILGTATDGTTYNVAMVSKWDVADFGSSNLHLNLNSKDGIATINDNKAIATKDEVEAVDAKVDALVIPSIDGLAVATAVTAEIAAAVAPLAVAADVYTKTEADDKFATKEELALKADSDKVYTQEDVDALLLAKENEIYNLTKIVGDIGGAVTYELPNAAGKSFNTLMNNNGTVKLTEDVTTNRFGPGIFASNKVALNLNGHNLTFSGLTIDSSFPAIFARGSEEISIGGKGTIDAGEGICIESSSADNVINLTGSTTVYQTNRPGGELIYANNGIINITNGTFKNNGSKFLLNCYDSNYKAGTAKIIVSSSSKTSGPHFFDFDPANNSAEGAGTNFVAEGCISVSSGVITSEMVGTKTYGYTITEADVDHVIYSVIKEG